MLKSKLYKKWFNKKEYYNSDILKSREIEDGHNPDIALIYSGRNRGKSFDISAKALVDAWYTNGAKKFGYIRRYDSELKLSNIERYFNDKIDFILDMTDKECNGIKAEGGSIYLVNYYSDKGKIVHDKVLCVGYYFALSLSVQYKSLQYPDISTMIFEEVFADRYIDDEAGKCLSLYSTIARGRTDVTFWLIANTTGKSGSVNPYTNEFGLRNIKSQKPDTINDYKLYLNEVDEFGNEKYLYIAVEYLKDRNSEIKSKNKTNLSKALSNEWEEARQYPCISQSIMKSFNTLSYAVFEYHDFRYLIEVKSVPCNLQTVVEYKRESNIDLEYVDEYMTVLFVSRKTSTIKPNTRLFTNKPIINKNTTLGYRITNDSDRVIERLFKIGWVFYSDNLLANEFKECLNKLTYL